MQTMKQALQLISLLLVLTIAACSRAPSPQEPTPTPANSPTASAPPAAATSEASMGAMPQVPTSLDDWARGAQLFDGLGTFHRKISTSSAEAQQYFDQGMRLMLGFNHDESSRSFARAAQLDP